MPAPTPTPDPDPIIKPNNTHNGTLPDVNPIPHPQPTPPKPATDPNDKTFTFYME